MISWAQLGIQDASSPVIEEFLFFHDFIIIVLAIILAFVGVLITGSLINKNISINILEAQFIERVWTLLPAVVLVEVAIPSLVLLYMVDEGRDSALTLKVLGHQWYWRYEYTDFWRSNGPIEFDSYLDRNATIRLLNVDNSPTIPTDANIRLLISSTDVLHAWALPTIGVKVDACPGRLNQIQFASHRPGVFFGQCSEICGANHRFIPISVEAGKALDFVEWINSQYTL